MNNITQNDDFLARWAAGTLSESEKKAFESTKDFQAYQAILNGTDVLEVPEFNSTALYKAIQDKKAQIPKVKRINPITKWVFAVAATVVIALGYLFFFNNNVNYTTGFGEQLAFSLPDDSNVILNAKSSLSFTKDQWKTERLLNLEGEAYFKVTKGKTFTVITKEGTISVLGTQFSVNAASNIFEVICYEGKVKVTHNTISKILPQGKALRIVNRKLENWESNTQSPSWLKQRSTFYNTPLLQVINALEKQYNISIEHKKLSINNIRYTGGFTHNNLNTALKTVFEPLKITFTFSTKKTIVLHRK